MNETTQKSPAPTNGDGLTTVSSEEIRIITGCFGPGYTSSHIHHRESRNGATDLIILIIIIIVIAIVVATVTLLWKKKLKKNKLLKTAVLTEIETKSNDTNVNEIQQPFS